MRPRSIARPAAGRRALLRFHLRRRRERARAVRHRPVHPDPVGRRRRSEAADRRARSQDRRARRAPAPPSAAPSAPAAGQSRGCSSRCRSSATAAGSRSTAIARPAAAATCCASASPARARRRCACASPPSRAWSASETRRVGKLRVYRWAYASWYGPGLYGNRTACGQTLGYGTLGVAHKSLPCGAKVTFKKGAPRGHGARHRPRPLRRRPRVRPDRAPPPASCASAATAPSSPRADAGDVYSGSASCGLGAARRCARRRRLVGERRHAHAEQPHGPRRRVGAQELDAPRA